MALRTTLHDWHASAGARFVEFGGWEMPLLYTTIVEEHLTVRRAVGVFDVSHMGKIVLEGPGAHSVLDFVSPGAVPRIPGRCAYTQLLRSDATIVDDVIVTCLAEDRYFVVCNAGPRETVVDFLHATLASVPRAPVGPTIRDVTTDYLCLAVQGRRAADVIQRLTPDDLSQVRPFEGVLLRPTPRRAEPSTPAALPSEIGGWGAQASRGAAIRGPDQPTVSTGDAVLATRTGYTGEDGFELFPPADAGRAWWEALLAEGTASGILPAGLGARDTLRLEKGFVLSGQDFDGRQTPLEVRSGWIVDWDRDFQGKPALEAQRARGDHPRLVGLRMCDRAIPRRGCRVLASGVPVGVVTSGTMSPSLRVGIALASVGFAHTRTGARVDVEIREEPHPAEVVRLPFL